jgi:ABC-2 type transport system permease protein
MWERIGVMLRKEFIQVLREPRMRLLLFLPPLIQLVVFGYAVTLDVDHARIGWMDMDHTPESRALRARFEGSGRFQVTAIAAKRTGVQRLLDRSQVHAWCACCRDSRATWRAAHGDQVQVLLDGTNSNTASLVSATPDR